MTDDSPGRRLPRDFTPEAIALTRQRFETTDDPLQAIAADLGISRRTLGKLAEREGWVTRASRPRFAPITRPAIQRARGFTPEAVAHARRRYEETDESMDRIAADLGVHRMTLDRLAKTEGWQLRKDRPPRDLPVALQLNLAAAEILQAARAAGKPPLQPMPEPAEVDRAMTDASLAEFESAEAEPVAASLALRLEAAVDRELRKVENLREDAVLGGSRATEAERIARTLAALTQTLFKVRQLREPGGVNADADEDLPADADEFRRQLAHRIEALVRCRDDGRVPAAGGDADAGAAAA
ncbi:hypothetical protein SR870_02380 [Rhodopseudomonas palustris]|uniref:hypothetical protein n=1 Tax=Rhodopseudomonas palustris TaxID=1076 RepID=UPI002ACDF071|nr:hypothetical protein [Rhodopseudomonas palustris]WQH00160.1 hypothetical protein SR870_02380 [Rhodopseudomonas palustris]